MFLRTNGESSSASSARCTHHQPTAMRFARSVRKNLRTFRQESTCFDENQPTFRRESPTFSSLPTACDGQQRISSLYRSHSQCNFPNSLAPSHAQRRATANSSAGGHELALNFGALLPHSPQCKGRKRQLRNTFARNTSNTTLIFAHSYRSPIKK